MHLRRESLHVAQQHLCQSEYRKLQPEAPHYCLYVIIIPPRLPRLIKELAQMLADRDDTHFEQKEPHTIDKRFPVGMAL